MPNLTIVGLEDNCHSDYQCFVFDGIKSAESPDIAEFIKRWVDEQFSGIKILMPPVEGEDYHVNVRHIDAITDASTHDVKDPHLYL
jgi:hypothetical protein